jgi:hypothetical protein
MASSIQNFCKGLDNLLNPMTKAMTIYSLYIITDWLATHGLDWQFDDSLPEDMILQPDASALINGYKVFDIRKRLMDGSNRPSCLQKTSNPLWLVPRRWFY